MSESANSNDTLKPSNRIKDFWLPVSLQRVSLIKDKLASTYAEFNATITPHQKPRKPCKAKLPWDNLPAQGQDYLKSEILKLSRDRNNFLGEPLSFNFCLEDNISLALLFLKLDPNLSKLRYGLVPGRYFIFSNPVE